MHDIRDAQPGAGASVTDPVCGMVVSPEQAAGSLEYEGRTYFFCGEHCLEKFRAEPERYAGRTEPRLTLRRLRREPAKVSMHVRCTPGCGWRNRERVRNVGWL